MREQIIQVTSYPEINDLLHELQVKIESILGDQFVGMYLHGSLASGDFDRERSDIDLLMVTSDVLPKQTLIELENTHKQLVASGSIWAPRLELSYIPQAAIRCYDQSRADHPMLGSDGSLPIKRHRSDWIIQYHILREQGIALTGPPLQTLIDPVSTEELRRATLEVLREWWTPPFPHPERFQEDDYPAYAILTMCRILYLMELGTVASKPTAARWAQQELDRRWAALIGEALEWQSSLPPPDREQMFDFMAYIVEHSRIIEPD
jgi:predicted nucleotidyltransferase